jgi:hypothetical protein
MAAKDFRLIEHPPYLPDLASGRLLLFPEYQKKLAGKTLTQETFKSMCEGGCQDHC